MMFKIILSRFALLIVLCLPATAMAVTACVSNTSQLEQALAGASDLADDVTGS